MECSGGGYQSNLLLFELAPLSPPAFQLPFALDDCHGPSRMGWDPTLPAWTTWASTAIIIQNVWKEPCTQYRMLANIGHVQRMLLANAKKETCLCTVVARSIMHTQVDCSE